MAEVPSTRLLPLGSTAPEFELPDPAGRLFTLDDVHGLLVMFVCNHCPYVVNLAKALAAISNGNWVTNPSIEVC
jgi:hypothetical protein